MGGRTEAETETAVLLADGSVPLTPEALIAKLEELGIAQRSVEHPPLFTVEQSKALRGQLPGGHTKNLFLRNKKGAMWLVTSLEDRPLDLKKLGELLGGGRLSFGSAERLMRHLGVLPGAVTPLAVINDHEAAVTLVLDAGLLEQEPVNVHPLTNEQTTAMAAADLIRFAESTGHPPRIVDLVQAERDPG
ncbi:prolyl-tRNA synthetase associated domain-containing protein [Algihabitans albus]|uniref:prolyl-tRNA synthetase associated domain-containing protein n=1 Tax=Algihabitans albus TaxID=2164067 RepID=UPI000E5C6D9D|nr:prolyl-tRNA synthetase associated domain-containing protein [Algihabitans albus]